MIRNLLAFGLLIPLAFRPLSAQDVRPDSTISTVGTDCTTGNAHTRLSDDPDDTWDEGNDCVDTTCTESSDTFPFVGTLALPSGNPTTGTDDQVMAVRARKCDDGQSGTPELKIDIECNGTAHEDGVNQNILWNAGEGTLVTEAWTFGGSCATDGSDVEIEIECDSAGGGPTARVGCDLHGAEWRSSVTVAGVRRVVVISLKRIPGTNRFSVGR